VAFLVNSVNIEIEEQHDFKDKHTVTNINEGTLPADTKELQLFLQEFPRQKATGLNSQLSKIEIRRTSLPKIQDIPWQNKRNSFDSISHQGDFAGLGGGKWSTRPAFTFQNILPFLLTQMHRNNRTCRVYMRHNLRLSVVYCGYNQRLGLPMRRN